MLKKDKTMRNLITKISALFLLGILLISCSNQQSLQEYYVDNQENNNFIMIDVPTSLISDDTQALDAEQKKVLKTLKKINLMAYPIKEETAANYDTEVAKVNTILAGDDYEQLMKMNSDEGGMKLYFKGEEEAIDEVIVFASEDSKGFMLARVLGDDMNINDMFSLMQSIEEGDIDVSQFEGIMDVFK